MGATASLSDTGLAVEPGSSITAQLRIYNTGTVVDSFTLQSLGDAAGWISVEPPQVNLFPGADEVTTITFAPPRAASSKAGPTPYAIRIISQEDPSGSTVVEDTIIVGEFRDQGAELAPTTAKGRLAARFDLAFDNRGNVPTAARVSGTDPEDALKFDIKPAELRASGGAAVFAKVRTKPRKRIWRGSPASHPFEVLISGDSGQTVVAGSMVQEPILSAWLWKIAALIAAGIIALTVLWLTVLKPSVESSARDIAQEELDVAFAAAGITTAPPAGGGGGDEDPDGGGDGDDTGDGGGLADLGSVTNFRIQLQAATGTSADEAQPVGENQLLSITDIVLQNPQGDSGLIRVLKNDEILFESALENFRDLDYHFVAPFVFRPTQSVRVEVDCREPGDGFAECRPAVSFAGFLETLG